MSLNRRAILDELFSTSPALESADDCAENIVIPFLLRLGYARGDIRRRVTIRSATGTAFRKQADVVVLHDEAPAMVVETKRLRHRLTADDANQVLAYGQLIDPPVPIAVLTNGRHWETYTASDESIGSLDDVPDPSALRALLAAGRPSVPNDVKLAAERMLATIEDKPRLEQAFRRCRQALSREGLIAESAFDELTKILACKFNEERKMAEGLGTYRFTIAWLDGEGPLNGLTQLFSDAKTTFHVFPAGESIRVRTNETAREIVEALEPFGFYGFQTPVGLAGAGGDVVGSVYEAFLAGTLRGDLGQYLTPRQLIDFMIELAEPKIGERILDLACGSGGFLIRAFLEVRKQIRSLDIAPAEQDAMITDLATNNLWGVEINPRLATLCRINMILHGDGYEHIYDGDSIRDDVFENTDSRRIDLSAVERGELPKFDLVLMNPPFNLPYDDQTTLNRYELGRGKATAGSDYLMLERALRLLSPDGGRLLIILPHGVASGSSEAEIREFVASRADLRACVSLPVGAFKPFGGSNARTCILYIVRDGNADGKRFLARAESVGYDITSKYYRPTDTNELLDIADEYERVKLELI